MRLLTQLTTLRGDPVRLVGLNKVWESRTAITRDIGRRYAATGRERVSGVHVARGGQRERSRQGSTPIRRYQFTQGQVVIV